MQHVPYRKHFYCSKNPTQLIKSVLRKKRFKLYCQRGGKRA